MVRVESFLKGGAHVALLLVSLWLFLPHEIPFYMVALGDGYSVEAWLCLELCSMLLVLLVRVS